MIAIGLALISAALRLRGGPVRPPALWADLTTWNDTATWSDRA